MTVDVVMVKSDLGKKRESPLSRINHVNDMPHDLFHRDGLAIFFASTPYNYVTGAATNSDAFMLG